MKISTYLRVACLTCLSMRLVGEVINEDSRIELVSPPDVFNLTWQSKVGRTYFVMSSDEQLANWYYLPVIEAGTGERLACGISFDPMPSRFFVRLKYTDQPADNVQTADFDEDGVSNWDELQGGIDPFDTDSDGDGLGDFIENVLGVASLKSSDSDGDSVPDAADAYPSDPSKQSYTGSFLVQILTPSTAIFQP